MQSEHSSFSSRLATFEMAPPQEKMPPYEPCWCGSGKKWKWCHKDREHQNPVPIWQLMSDCRENQVVGYCLHPQADSSTCSTISRSHTIQRKGGLSTIAEAGHVLTPMREFRTDIESLASFEPRRVGIGTASTFMGFCGKHDNELFAPIEKRPMVIDQESAFLLSFRSVCYELFSQECALKNVDIARDLDKGKPFWIQCVVQKDVQTKAARFTESLEYVRRLRDRFVKTFDAQGGSEFHYHAFMFSERLPFVACGVFFLDLDINGNRLQLLDRECENFDQICCNMTNLHNTAVAVFGWFDDNQSATRLVESLRRVRNHCLANQLLFLLCDHIENMYLQLSWWSSLPDDSRDALRSLFARGIDGSLRDPVNFESRTCGLTASLLDEWQG